LILNEQKVSNNFNSSNQGYYCIRGVVQKTENGKVYEADWEITIANTTEGTRLEHSQRFTDWIEVK